MADFDESDIPKEVPVSEESEKDPENVIRGHKATLSNPSRFPNHPSVWSPCG